MSVENDKNGKQKDLSYGVNSLLMQGTKGQLALTTIATLLRNIIASPSVEKYRKIRKMNVKIKSRIVETPGAIMLLECAGFIQDDTSIFLPLSAGLAKAEDVLSAISDLTPTKDEHQNQDTADERPAHAIQVSDAEVVEKYESISATLESCSALAMEYEDPWLQEKARQSIPLYKLTQKAEAEVDSDTDLSEQLLRQLLRWFKAEFFQWVNCPSCCICQGPTRSIGNGHPSSQEMADGAGRVELFTCDFCGAETRFPRYRRPAKLLETRKGRCGEWANCFTLLCRALGYEARYIWDNTDHVWTEVWLAREQRWVHCDCCENIMDRPLVYEAGWGKALSYIFAFSCEEVVDVTRRYTRDFNDCCTRRPIPETLLAETIARHDTQQQVWLSPTRKTQLGVRRAREASELLAPKLGAAGEELIGRRSGDKAWRQARGESGPVAPPLPAVAMTCVVDTAANGTAWLHTLKDATLTDKGICLTPLTQDRRGAAWCKTKVSVEGGLVSEFAMQITGNGADGMAFVIQNCALDSLGEGGGGLGYSGISKCVAVEFDTYEGLLDCDDPSANHISVMTNGSDPVTSHHRHSLGHTNKIPQLNSGEKVHVRIVYEPTGKLHVDLHMGSQPEADMKRVLTVDVNLPQIMGDTCAWLGFTAATGGLAQRHVVDDWSVNTFGP